MWNSGLFLLLDAKGDANLDRMRRPGELLWSGPGTMLMSKASHTDVAGYESIVASLVTVVIDALSVQSGRKSAETGLAGSKERPAAADWHMMQRLRRRTGL